MDTIIEQVSDYVQGLFDEFIKPEQTYHNLMHTRRVVNHSIEMIQYYQLSADESRIIQVAAWFHDVGHLFVGMYGHERVSVEKMRGFLTRTDIDSNHIELIAGCIMCTRLPSNPNRLLEKILCDADTYHLGTQEFWESDKAVKRELQLSGETILDNWDKRTLHFLEQHQFYTAYCQQRLNAGKQANIQILRTRIMNGD